MGLRYEIKRGLKRKSHRAFRKWSRHARRRCTLATQGATTDCERQRAMSGRTGRAQSSGGKKRGIVVAPQGLFGSGVAQPATFQRGWQRWIPVLGKGQLCVARINQMRGLLRQARCNHILLPVCGVRCLEGQAHGGVAH